MENIKFEKSFNVNGTSLKGYITASYRQLVEMFGEPSFGASGDDKQTFSFVIGYEFTDEDETGTGVFTLYDWKGSRPYDDNQEFSINVGGKSFNDSIVADIALEIFNNTDARFVADKACLEGQSFDIEGGRLYA